jgi:hypothetical protein
MIVFDVFLNKGKLCRAGVGTDGVLNAIVSWVRLTGEAARTARRLRQPAEELRLHVGGLRGGIHRRWPERPLSIGDTVTIAVGSAGRCDPPQVQKHEDPTVRQQQEKRYYLYLKRKYEGGRHSRNMPRAEADEKTRFLNVDLDIWSRSPLQALSDAFGKHVCVLHVGKENRRYGAHLELARFAGDADSVIRRFTSLVDQLPHPARMMWDQAHTREFNVGVQAGTSPHGYQLHLRPETVVAVARIGARLGVTVYGVDLPSARK